MWNVLYPHVVIHFVLLKHQRCRFERNPAHGPISFFFQIPKNEPVLLTEFSTSSQRIS